MIFLFVQHSGWETQQIFAVSQEIIISDCQVAECDVDSPAVTPEILSQEAPVLPIIVINMAKFGQQ